MSKIEEAGRKAMKALKAYGQCFPVPMYGTAPEDQRWQAKTIAAGKQAAAELESALAAPAPQPEYRLGPLPEPASRERIYTGHGNEEVIEHFDRHQMREYARQEVYRVEQRWAAKTEASSVTDRKPLTLDQIGDLEFGQAGVSLTWDQRVTIVRGTERAHGITAAPEGKQS